MAALFRALIDTIAEFRHRIRIFSPRSSLHALVQQYGGGLEFAYPRRDGVESA